MEPIEHLRQALRTINETTFQGLHFDHRLIQQEVKKLRETLIDKPDPRPPIDQMQTAVAGFLNTSDLNNFRDTRLVCYGAATPFGHDQIRLIEKNKHFPKLLKVINGYRNRPRIYRRFYRGLLVSYFNYDPEAPYAKDIGHFNWHILRHYLNDHITHIQAEGITPDWVAALQEHRNLLTDDPCSRYAQAFLDGVYDVFNDVEKQFGFAAGSSWVTRAVVDACIDAAIRLSDREFKHYLPELLKLLGNPRHATLLNPGLAKLLDRYANTQPLILHPELRNFAVAHWKNPWLEINHNRWALVSEPARKMVTDWLKLDLIQSFFELLTADGSNDTRRLNFWIRYVDQITDMYFALGRYAMQNQDTSFVELRNKMAGRLLKLSGTGKENNAFIMTINDYVFIEFGMRNHATYIYREYPFALDGSRDINLNALKDTSTNIERLRHQDNVLRYNRWELRFNAHLYQHFGIQVPNTGEIPEPWRSGSYYNYTAGNAANIKTFCQTFKLGMEDPRLSGGYFWILADDQTTIINQQLRAWGFSYRAGRGWFRNS